MTAGYQLNGLDLDTAFVRRDSFYAPAGLWGTGYNILGQLGDSTTVNKSSPVQTSAGGPMWTKRFSSGNSHTVAIKTDGTLWSWGSSANGQLGNTSVSYPLTSPKMIGSSNDSWSLVACGQYHTLATKIDGTLWGWGDNSQKQIRDLGITSFGTPQLLSNTATITGNSWTNLSGGQHHSAAISSKGRLYLWGRNDYGQLGSNTTTSTGILKETVSNTTNWKQVSCGEIHTAAIKTDGTLWGWGHALSSQLGISYNDMLEGNRSSPIQTAAGGTNWKQVVCGAFHTMAIKGDGTLWGWGSNGNGQLGVDPVIDSSLQTPVQILGYSTMWKQINAGYNHSSGIKTDGTLWTWGYNGLGALGDGTTVDKYSPVQISGNQWSYVSAGGFGGRVTLALAEEKW